MAVLISLLSCSTKNSVLPQSGPTMKEVYNNHYRHVGQSNLNQSRFLLGGSISNNDDGLKGYTRTAKTELESIFPRLPNPNLVMFIFPHLSAEDRSPIPGYSTYFPMYERVEYALPGEVRDYNE